MAIIKQDLMDTIITRLQGITIDNGHDFEVGTTRVHREHEIPENVATPAIVLIEGDEIVEPSSFESYSCTTPIAAVFAADVGRNETADVTARKMIAAIQRVIGVEIALTSQNYSTDAEAPVTVQILETGNEWSTDGQTVSGSVDINAIYDRSLYDPRKV